MPKLAVGAGVVLFFALLLNPISRVYLAMSGVGDPWAMLTGKEKIPVGKTAKAVFEWMNNNLGDGVKHPAKIVVHPFKNSLSSFSNGNFIVG